MRTKAVKNFINFLNRTTKIPPEEYDHFISLLDYVEIEKNEKFIASGKNCHEMYFLSEGFVKYELNQPNQLKVIHISGGGAFISDFYSYFSGQPAITDVYTITASKFLVASRASIEQLYAQSITWANFGRKHAENALVNQIMERIRLQTLSPEERYIQILNAQPELFEVIKLGDLAQVLGITQETLSRIRRRLK